MNAPSEHPATISRLRRLATPAAVLERCELCGADIGTEHAHLLEPKSRQLRCACEACAILFSGNADQRYRRVPRRIVRLAALPVGDEIFASLPINLAFFFRGADGKLTAMYPSPAGATESLLPMDSGLEAALGPMQPEVEALLVNRVGGRRDAYIVPIDRCYHLVGLIRTQWRGLSGGAEVWRQVVEFFDDLARRSSPGPAHA
jgi:hypothetical protein